MLLVHVISYRRASTANTKHCGLLWKNTTNLKEQREVYATSFCFERNLEGANRDFLHRRRKTNLKFLLKMLFNFTHPQNALQTSAERVIESGKINEKNETGIADTV